MSLALIPGQNALLRPRVLRFTASSEIPLDLSALAIGEERVALASDNFVFYNQPTAAGVTLGADSVLVDLDDVAAGATSVLCIVSADPPATPLRQLAARLADPAEAVVAEFTVALVGLETAVICFELYRRGSDWKVRAVGQGYAGGLAQLLSVHGVEVHDAPAPPPPPAPARPIEIEPLDPQRSLERMWMIFEDAARSTSAVNSARAFALTRLDEELSAAVEDPATRHSSAAADARTAAQNRHDELVSSAEASYQNDAVHLITELDTVNPVLPRSLSSWESPAWQSHSDNPLVGNGIRLGGVSAAERGLLRVPFCIPAPLRRPLWVDTTNAAAAMPVVMAIVLRLLAATPSPAPVLDVVDLTGSLRALTDPLTSVMPGPVVDSHHDVSTKLSELAHLVELAEFAAQSGLSAVDAPARVLVLSDFGHGLQTDDLTRVAVLAGQAAVARLSVVIVGEGASESPEPLLAAISQHCQHIPTGVGDSSFVDPWTRNTWEFTPDVVPQEANRVSQFIDCIIG